MRLLTLPAALSLFVGATLLLGELRWFRRPSLARRIGPYLPGSRAAAAAGAVDVLRSVLVSSTARAASTATRVLGVREELALRLERVHARTTPTEFRLGQLGWAAGALVGAGVVVASLRPSPPLVVVFLLGAPALAFLGLEQRLLSAAQRWQRQVVTELPVVAEQLGMLTGAGFSVGAALQRLADHGRGTVARDLRRVGRRIRHGVPEHVALSEWAEVSGLPAVHRLVAVLSLDRDTADLGRLVSDEARAIRLEAHRSLVEVIERRGQQVWIPVTVATLVPGVLFLVAPFVSAMELFTAG